MQDKYGLEHFIVKLPVRLSIEMSAGYSQHLGHALESERLLLLVPLCELLELERVELAFEL